MRYAILLYDDAAEGQEPPAAATLAASGQLVLGERLLPARAATCVRTRGGGPAIEAGPCGGGPHLGAVYVIDAPHLDDAIAWADRLSAAGGAGTEIRPCVAELSIPARSTPSPHAPHLEDPCST